MVRALARGEQQQRVAGRRVAVHGDGIERWLDGRDKQFLQAPRAGRLASVKTKDSIVAMSGAIMPEPLAMPLIVTVAVDHGRGGRELGIGVGGHDRFGGGAPAVGGACVGQLSPEPW